jgi:ribosomal protein L11 methyltransferase
MPSPTAPVDPAEEIRNRVRRLIGGRRMPPADIIKEIGGLLKLEKNRVQRAIHDLVATGEIAYTYEHGRTFLEPSFDRPVRVAERIVLIPPEKGFASGPEDVVIRIMPGASFGAGRHPTTRLSLRGIEFALARCEKPPIGPGTRVLDIGTGTGVLAMAAVLLGIEGGIGIDLDPCAVAEARANVRLNELDARIAVDDTALERISGPFALIAANLRLPTLLRLAPSIAAFTPPGAAVVISGIRLEEAETLLSAYADHSFAQMWYDEEDDWVGVSLVKRARPEK